VTDFIWDYDLICFLDSTYTLFLLLLFYSYFTFYFYFTVFYSALSVLPYLLCLFNVISVITTSCNRAFSGFQCFPVRVAICPDESLLLVGWNVGVVFTFTTVERRLLLLTVSSFNLNFTSDNSTKITYSLGMLVQSNNCLIHLVLFILRDLYYVILFIMLCNIFYT